MRDQLIQYGVVAAFGALCFGCGWLIAFIVTRNQWRGEVRYADGNVSRIPPLIEELVRLKPDIIVSGTLAGVIAAKKLTNTIPIVCADLTNPIEFGLAASYARPGGNVTGVLLTVEDLPTKQLALAVEVIPGAKKIGLLVHSDNPMQPALQRSLDASVNALGVQLTVLEVASPDDLHAAFQRLARERVKVVMLLADFMFLNERKRIALFAMAERLPTMFAFRENVEDGGLMSYGTNVRESWRRTASFVDKILKGAKPGDLPIEFPTKLELLINLTTAKALELTIPPTLLARADEVIGMRRREFITLLGGAAAAWPLGVHAQQPGDRFIVLAQAMIPRTGMMDAQNPMPMKERYLKRFPQPARVSHLIGMPVLDLNSKTLGYVRRVVRNPAGEIQFIVDYSQWWGWFGRPVAVPLEALGIEGGHLVSLDMSPSEYAASPTWRDTETTPLPDDAIVRVALSRS